MWFPGVLKIGGINCTQGECIWLRFYRNHCIWFIWLIFFILFSMLTLFTSFIYCVKVKVIQSCLTPCDPMDYTVHGILQARRRVGSLSLLQVIFPTQEWNPGLQHCRRIPYQLSHQGSPRILEWVAYPFSKGSSWPRNETAVSSMQADSLPTELWGKPFSCIRSVQK